MLKSQVAELEVGLHIIKQTLELAFAVELSSMFIMKFNLKIHFLSCWLQYLDEIPLISLFQMSCHG